MMIDIPSQDGRGQRGTHGREGNNGKAREDVAQEEITNPRERKMKEINEPTWTWRVGARDRQDVL